MDESVQTAWEGPGITALGLAAARTLETARSDALIADPHAAVFLDAAGASASFPTRWPASGAAVSEREALHLQGSSFVGVRTKWYDDLIAEQTGVAHQCVLLAAGLDLRAFRLDLPPAVTVFELDQPAVLSFKDAVLVERHATPSCGRQAVGVDLCADWRSALEQTGFDRGQPTMWVAEGLLGYLPPDGEAALLRTVHDLSAPDSTFAFDHLADPGRSRSAGTVDELSRRSGIDMASLLNTSARPAPTEALTELGWRVEQQSAEELGKRYRRDLSSQDEPPWLATTFVTARKG